MDVGQLINELQRLSIDCGLGGVDLSMIICEHFQHFNRNEVINAFEELARIYPLPTFIEINCALSERNGSID